MSLCVFTQPSERKHWACRLHWSCRSPERVQGASSIRVSFEVIHLVISYKMIQFQFRAVHLHMYHTVDLYRIVGKFCGH